MLKHCKFLENVWQLIFCEERSCWSALWSHGRNAWWICRWVHGRCHWCLRHATDIDNCECWICGSCLLVADDGLLQASWKTWNVRRMVPFTSRIWLLALDGRCANIKVIRTTWIAISRCSNWSSVKCQRPCNNGLLPINSHEQLDDEFGAKDIYSKWLLDKN